MTNIDSPLLSAKKISKVFVGEGYGDSRTRRELIIALKDLDFELHRGEIIGVIGGNGSGKTTLLRALANTTRLTSGSIDRQFPPRTIISLSSNLNGQLSVRENIYLYGSLLGITRQELSRNESQIINSAGLSAVADEPIRQLSLGMKMRLGFAIATSGYPEILLIDEVIAAGDASWQQSGFDTIRKLSEGGTGVVIATHDLSGLAGLATRVMWLKDGQIIKSGPPAEVIADYQTEASQSGQAASDHNPLDA